MPEGRRKRFCTAYLCMSVLYQGDEMQISPMESTFFRDVERVKGIEPSYEAWEAAVLPLNYTRNGVRFYFKRGRHPSVTARCRRSGTACRRGGPRSSRARRSFH